MTGQLRIRSVLIAEIPQLLVAALAAGVIWRGSWDERLTAVAFAGGAILLAAVVLRRIVGTTVLELDQQRLRIRRGLYGRMWTAPRESVANVIVDGALANPTVKVVTQDSPAPSFAARFRWGRRDLTQTFIDTLRENGVSVEASERDIAWMQRMRDGQ